MTEREQLRLAKLTEKMEQMKAQKQDILAKEKKRQRQERTKRLIEIGALSEKYFDMKDVLPKDYEMFLQIIFSGKNIDEFISGSKEIWNKARVDNGNANMEKSITANTDGANPKS